MLSIQELIKEIDSKIAAMHRSRAALQEIMITTNGNGRRRRDAPSDEPIVARALERLARVRGNGHGPVTARRGTVKTEKMTALQNYLAKFSGEKFTAMELDRKVFGNKTNRHAYVYTLLNELVAGNKVRVTVAADQPKQFSIAE